MYKGKANKGHEKKDGLMIPWNNWKDWLPSEMRTEAQKEAFKTSKYLQSLFKAGHSAKAGNSEATIPTSIILTKIRS